MTTPARRLWKKLWKIAQRNLVTLYGVSTVAFGFDSDSEKYLIRLAEETGGRVVWPLQYVYGDVQGFVRGCLPTRATMP